MDAQVCSAKLATRQVSSIAPYPALDALREHEIGTAKKHSQQDGVLATLTAFDPNEWTLVRFTLWRDAAVAKTAAQFADSPADVQAYEVGHLSAPGY